MSWIDELAYDERGLVPVVAQDAASGEVLMLAWANAEAVRLTAETGDAHYWSRSRGELWRKGGTSGHVQRVREVRVDCDRDALVYRVEQSGPACHTGERTCFYRAPDGDSLAEAADSRPVLTRIDDIIEQRHAERPEGSYTTYLFDKGVDKILKKVGEEAAETIIAAKNSGTDELRSEAADLVFHLLVLLRERGLPLSDVYAELDARFGAAPRAGSTAPPPSRSSDGT
ncbi:MAG TPA: bifunctional phosphoribosyl-AMP cyclohydrolase/phosphoribosyl-ATP diphosphatase HisIE [Longimicrobiaceae bacterium]|jgi:phosphoribosyl-ATP pyrophosphohydrolase/phosphoribosyl-AMP cyclohydrolase|nr:bifunctional phosphoribosyl-AMP cyclohydrolase/phosphoribosyl-ATP diphosphatase HisIE [Longimicrobiaceae bacterium]